MSRRLIDGKVGKPKKGSDPGGRPTKFEIDPELPKKLRQAILIGAPILTAAALHDISYETMRGWVLKGKEDPSSEYGALLKIIQKSIAEWEARDLSVIEAHAVGRPAQYLQQPMRNEAGEVVLGPEGKPLMEYVRDAEGNPILQAAEIKSDWRAAMERLSRRKPRSWAKQLNIDLDAVLTFDNNEREAKPAEALTFEQKIAQAVKELEEEV